jgi:hypothetical protein
MTACSNRGEVNTSLIDTVSTKEILENSVNRTFKEGINETKEDQETSISVIYTGNLDNILLDESSTLYKAINKYQLNLQDPFKIDETMRGIILTSYVDMEDPISIAKEISNSEVILMVEVRNFLGNEVHS